MNNTILNGLQIFNTKSTHGLVDTRSLDHLMQTKPHDMGVILSQIFGNYKGLEVNVLDTFTRGLGRTKMVEIDQSEYDWGIDMDFDENVPIIRAEWNGSLVSSTDYPGLGLTPITLYLKAPKYGVGAVLSFDDRQIQVRVQSQPYQAADAWVYTCVMADGNPESYVPYTYLAPGKRVAREGMAYEEGSEEADIISYASGVKLRNKLTTMRMKFDITRSAATTTTVAQWVDPITKKKSYFFTDKQVWTAWREWYRRQDNYGVYSRYNSRPDGTVNVFGTNGRPVHIGAGILQQFAPTNVRPHTGITAGLIQDFLGDLSFNKLGRGERKFLGLTGEYGMIEFSKMLETKAASFTLTDSVFISGNGQNLTFGGQFTTWKLYNGIELTLAPFKWFDDPNMNRLLDPLTGRPASSKDILFIDIGMRDGDANLKKVIKRGSENLVWYTGGSIGPNNKMAKNISELRSNAFDGFSVNFLTEAGYFLGDPTTCGWLQYKVA